MKLLYEQDFANAVKYEEEGERLLREQEVRMKRRQRLGIITPQAKKLLEFVRSTQEVLVSHLRRIERELGEKA